MELSHELKLKTYQKTIEELKEKNLDGMLLNPKEVEKLEQNFEALKKKVYQKLSPWERVQIARHLKRPKTLDYIHHMCDEFFELFGDRAFADDHAIVGGLAVIGGHRFVIIGSEKGSDTEARIYRNFGMLHPEGFRKAMRLMKLAEKFNLPVVSLLDTAGAFPGLSAEERGQGWLIASNLREMARIKTRMIVLIIGEGFSGGALGIGMGDCIGMLEHACYSVITPEGCASILWKDASKNDEAAKALKMNAEDLLELEVIDQIIPEPLEGAHTHPELMYDRAKSFIIKNYQKLLSFTIPQILELRYQKFRKLGRFERLGQL